MDKSGLALALTRTAQTPLYMQLASKLHDGLQHGRWTPNDALPSERMLSDALSVSRDTARKALALLCARGVLTRVRGSGTYPAGCAPLGEAPPREPPKPRWQSRELGRASAEEVLALGLSPEAEVVRCTSLSGPAGQPTAIVSSVVPLRYMPQPVDWHMDMDSYFQALGWADTRLLQRVRAVCATPEQARQLGVGPGTALLQVKQVRYASQGQALELCHTHWLGAKADYCVELRRTP
ncbi:MAG: GntR family transcriptional regulator [Burkholderiaceae bacterium]|nr:GntR family transcriptional regulator [Burkholderiaceae bacterium]